MNSLAGGLIVMITAIAAVNTADGEPPRATWRASFVLIAGVVCLVVCFTAVGLLLR